MLIIDQTSCNFLATTTSKILIHKATQLLIFLYLLLGTHPAAVTVKEGTMYVTRPLSLYRKSPSALSMEPPEGPYTGYLVLSDEEAEAQDAFCWGLGKRREVESIPFPQDRILKVVHISELHQETMSEKVWFLPVLDRPLSANLYYVIEAKGKYKGLACASSKEMDMGICCLKNVIYDLKPRPLDPRNVYQQFKIHRHYGKSFYSKSLAPDGLPPKYLRKKGWELRSSRYYKPELSDALGLDVSLRSQLPSFDFPLYKKRSPSVIVGTWYCPFVFVREEARPREQMKSSILYKMTLEQHWKEIYSCQNVTSESNVVTINVNVQREVDSIFGVEAMKEKRASHGKIVWYKSRNGNGGRGFSVGLSFAVMEKMKWVQEEGGWIDGPEKNVRVEKVVEIRSGEWRRFGCYVLVERFMLRRMDGTLVLKCDFRHTDKIRCKCE